MQRESTTSTEAQCTATNSISECVVINAVKICQAFLSTYKLDDSNYIYGDGVWFNKVIILFLITKQ